MNDELFIADEIEINAPSEIVWDLLVNPEKTVLYMYGCRVETDWQVGSTILWIGAKDNVTYVKGEIISIEDGLRLVYSVIDPHGKYEDVPENYLQVMYDLEATGHDTLLKVRQGNYATVANGVERHQDSISQGGWKSILEQIKILAEG